MGFKHLVIICATLCIGQNSYAMPPCVEADMHRFKQAQNALATKDWSQFATLQKVLSQHPLRSYLDYEYLLKKENPLTSDEVKDFASKYPLSPLHHKLRAHFLSQFIQGEQWQDFLLHYNAEKDDGFYCHYIKALTETGLLAKARQSLKAAFEKSVELPPICRALLKDPNLKLQFESAFLWNRFIAFLRNNQPYHAKRLLFFFPETEKSYAKRMLLFHKKPHLLKPETFTDAPIDRNIMSHGLYRLGLKKPKRGMGLWAKWQKQFSFNENQTNHIITGITMGLLTENHPAAPKWASKIKASNKTPALRAWEIRYWIKRNRWERVKQHIEKLPEHMQAKPIWRYWYGRSLGKLGFDKQSRETYQTLLGERHFYGILAAQRLDMKPTFHNETPSVSPQVLYAVATHPPMKRAYLWYRQKEYTKARLEWAKGLENLSKQQLYCAANLAHFWGWHERAIHTINRTQHKDALSIRFPFGYLSLVKPNQAKAAIPPSLVFAVIRQESAFMPDAKSPKGALGLMQVLPSTAAMYDDDDDNTQDKFKLLVPANNIEIGRAHLERIKKNFNGAIIPTLAAYNAGQRQVKKWLPRQKEMEADVWIETLPWKETRNYLKNIITYQAIYAVLLAAEKKDGEPIEIIDMMSTPIPAHF